MRSLPVFRGAYRSRRAIIPATAFYEWKRDGDLKQAMAIARADSQPLALAGLWESWTDRDNGEIKRTFAIITTTANALMAKIHDRMPVILETSDYQSWLNGSDKDVADLMRPASDDILTAWPVSPLVNNVRNNGPKLLVPARIAGAKSGLNPA